MSARSASRKIVRITCDVEHRLTPEDLTPLQGELKVLTKLKYEKLKRSLLRHGFVFPEYVWKNDGKNYITDGHQRIRALQKMREEGVELEGGKVPVVFVHAKDRKQALELILAATSQYGQLGEESIYQFVMGNSLEWDELEPFVAFPSIDMEKLEKGWFNSTWKPDDHENEIPALPKRAITKAGDQWVLGDHVLICGDAREPKNYPQSANLLVTDPPYGVSYASKNRFLNALAKGNRIQEPILGDHETEQKMSALWTNAFRAAFVAMAPGACYYVTGPQGGDLLLLLLLALKESGLTLKHMLIWAKNNHVLGRSDYHYQHEPIIYGWKEGAAHFFGGARGETSLWQIRRSHNSDLHPTMKPTALFSKAIKNSTHRGDLVLDNFAGSGTAAIACESLGRSGHMIEIDPRYCDVAIERWQGYTGGKAHRMSGRQKIGSRRKK